MIFRNLTAAGDWSFGQGLSNYISGNPAIGLNIRTRLYSWLKDCFFDQGAGIDWANRLGDKNQKNLLDSDLRRVILQSFGVTSLNSLSLTVNNRGFSASYSVDTIFSKAYIDQINQEF